MLVRIQPLVQFKLKFNLMKTEIKNILDNLVDSVLNSIGDQIKGTVKDTREDIINKNIDIALFKIDIVKKQTIKKIINKLTGSSKSNQVYNVLNEEL